MLLNGFNVAASLIKKGEDPGMTRTDMAKLFTLSKSDLTAARERTGCYSLTRYHLNEAASFLEVDVSDLVYRVTPNMLKTDGDGKMAVTGQQGADFGATTLDPNADYTASLTSNTSIDSLLSDFQAKGIGGDVSPQEFKKRFEFMQEAAEAVDGSLVASMLGFCHGTVLARYNAKRISDGKGLGRVTTEVGNMAIGLTHLMLALFGAASTGTALGMIRRFITTGEYSSYQEVASLTHWLQVASLNLVGRQNRGSASEYQANVRFSNLADKAQTVATMYKTSSLTSDSIQASGLGLPRIEDAVVTKSIESFMATVADQITEKLSDGDTLDVEALVAKANDLLAKTPQMIRNQV